MDELRRSIQNLANGILAGRQSAPVILDKGVLDSIHGLDRKIIRARRPIEIKSENFKLKYAGLGRFLVLFFVFRWLGYVVCLVALSTIRFLGWSGRYLSLLVL